MAQMMGEKGFVYGVDCVKELTKMSQKNINKSHSEKLDHGKIILSTGNGYEGLPQFAPFDCIHIGAAVNKIPRKLFG